MFPGDAKNLRAHGWRWGRWRDGQWLGHGRNRASILKERVRGEGHNCTCIVKLLLRCVLNRIGGGKGKNGVLFRRLSNATV